MNAKNFKIETQLKFGFAVLLLFVIVLGTVSYLQTDKIHQQAETMYNHPLLVRRAISMVRSDILAIQRDIKDLFLAADENEIALDLSQIETSEANAFEQIDILYGRYLGPRADIDSVKKAFIIWNSMCEETTRLLRAGKTREAANRAKSSGVAGKQAEVLSTALNKIDDVSNNKSAALFATSRDLSESLNRELILLVAAILLLSLVIGTILLRNIRKPLNELTDAAQRFHKGDTDARSLYESRNEFGLLSASFNTLAEDIQMNMDLNQKVANLSGIMLTEDDAGKFFHATLTALATHTRSQLAAVYLLSEDKKTFDHFESIGTDDAARLSFAADSLEGEFGAVLVSRKVQHIKNLPEDTRFVFHAVSGKFIPHEIITIPILAGNEVIAISSLASVSAYDKQSMQFIDNILHMLSARVAGVLGTRKIKKVSLQLEHQNRELESQKTELKSQSAELMGQNAELEVQKKRLDEASRLKTAFLSNVSHELRTPLNSIIVLTGVLNRRLARQIPEEEYSYLEVIERNGKHLLSLINDILDISRIEAGHEEIEVTKFNANNLIAEVADMIRPQAKQKNIELVHVDSETNVTVSGDAGKCLQILQNLIGNAVKFTEEGRVEITARQRDRHLEITVTDTGIGIGETHLPHIFDEFRQADGGTSRKFGGTGLGLAIVKKYANLLGGAISVKSTAGQGSEFILILPLRHAAENRMIETETPTDLRHAIKQIAHKPVSDSSEATITAEMVKPQRELQTINGKPVVLVVEDNPDNMLTVKALLAGDCTVIEAADSSVGIEMANKHKPNLILMDIALPGMDGIEAFRTVRKNARLQHIPVIALTASAMTRDRETILAYGFDAYIAKPIDERLFFKSIYEALYG